MEAEEEDEEREDTPGLPPVSAAPVRQNAGDGPELTAEGEKPALAQAEKWEWARELERSLAETPAETETKTEAPAPDGGRQSALEALGWDGPAIPVRRQNGSTVLRIPGAGDLEAAELRGANRDPLPTAGPEGDREGGAVSRASMLQYSLGTKARISSSRSTIIRTATDCTRPAESPLRMVLTRKGLRV